MNASAMHGTGVLMERMWCAMDDMVKRARGYARRGWSVFPLWWIEDGQCGCKQSGCRSQGKHPIGPLVPRGVHEATQDPMTISQWWAGYPDANIGFATGEVSGIVVLDVDADKGGETSLERLETRNDSLPDTWIVETGGGGLHIYFSAPAVPVGCSASRLGPGLDVRGDGGYVVAPPSAHASGTPYRWHEQFHPKRTPLSPIPQWLLERLSGDLTGAREATTVIGPIPDGQRDVTLTSFAGSMRQRGMSEAAIVAALRVENTTRCQPPLPDRDVRRVAWSISRDAYAPSRQGTVRVAS